MPNIAETHRLIVRSWNLEDIQTLCDLTTQPGLDEFSVSGYRNFSEKYARQWIEKEIIRFHKNRLGKFAVLLKESNEVIGISGLFQMPPPLDSTVELNYRYPKAWRGQGFALEAAKAILAYGFDELGLSEIYANVAIDNLPSKKILQRLGMKEVAKISYEGIQAERWRIRKAEVRDLMNGQDI